ncbi:ATP-binding protein [Aquihabitans sp. McL0605]|uniref:ATP-binding protein n=1 Tax=Aquihabitans sp. McL0605 TaxID=3415671 RepID=UPI003CF2E7EE
MRRRLLRAFLAVIVVGVTVLGVPLGIIASHLAREQAVRSLDREADAIGFAISEPSEQGKPVPASAVSTAARDDRYVVVRDAAGRTTRVGSRPGGRTIEAQIDTATGVHITVLASAREADGRTVEAWLIVAGLAVAGMAVAVALAVREANRLGRPLDDLAAASRRLGAGDFSVPVAPVGIPEVDAVGAALTSSSARIADLVRREREFSSNASHQLRTPLTALRVRLEEAAMGGPDEMGPALEDAFLEVDRLDATISELLTLARSDAVTTTELGAAGDVFDATRARWDPLAAPDGRRIDVDLEAGVAEALIPARPIAEVLNVLIENALQHGRGTVRLRARRTNGHLVVTVSDDGPGIPAGFDQAIFTRHVSVGNGSGVGLALARTLVQSVGGRLELADARRAEFELYLPLGSLSGPSEGLPEIASELPAGHPDET